MFAPNLYRVYKFSLLDILKNDFSMFENLKQYIIKQQDNMLFRQTRIISKSNSEFNKYCAFVSCEGYKSNLESFTELIENGFYIKEIHFSISERSSSMTRNGILSFVSDEIFSELDEAITMGIEIDENVLSKYIAYRGLMFSSCHCIENWVPKIIIVKDCFSIIKNQKIKFLEDSETEYIDNVTGEKKKWKQKAVVSGTKDIEINMFDGSGICHPNIAKEIQRRIRSGTETTSIQIRAPYMKGVIHAIDYPLFFREHGIKTIVDIWGVKHDSQEEMVIMCESMYKGLKYFKKFGDVRDWESYWYNFKKYNHCFAVSKWNFSREEEPVYTRANYQILQDLELDYERFSSLAQYSTDWVQNIVSDDIFYTYSFLGLFYDSHSPMNEYTRAIFKNPQMVKEKCVHDYLVNLVRKYMDEMKCGKIWVKACFKIFTPDLIALMEHIGGLEVNGCLGESEFYSNDKNGDVIGERLIDRNPHICKSEHTVLSGVSNELTKKYISHLSNILMSNVKSITMCRLNGADFDGDLVLLVNDKTMLSGVNRDCEIVIDIEDKATALKEKYTKKNITSLIIRTMKSMIGEASNCATSYRNRMPQTDETKRKYESYIDLLSVVTGKSIDFCKTGVIFNIPKYISKYSKPLPYFMKYASPYYSKMTKFNCSRSNMNRLAKDVEAWQKREIRFKRISGFDYSIMMDSHTQIDEERFKQIEIIFLDFCKSMDDNAKFGYKCKNYDKFKDYFLMFYSDQSEDVLRSFEVNWNFFYESYRKQCESICPDKQELANIAVELCYKKYPNKNKKFLWKVASAGLLLNIKQCNVELPIRDDNGKLEYLGKKYSLRKAVNIDK